MGWSCNAKAGWVLDAWINACFAQSGCQNNFEANGQKYFFETSRKEHNDGAITGVVWRNLPDGKSCRQSGSFRIEGDGTVTRAPAFLKAASPSKEEIERRYNQTYGTGRIGLGSNGLSFDDANDPELLAKLK